MATQVFEATDETREQLEALLQRFSGYRYPPDIVKAQSYVNVCVALLGLPVSEIDSAGERLRLETMRVRELLVDAERFIASQAINLSPPISYAQACDWRY